MNYMIIYQKQNGNMLYRINKTKPTYNKGDTTSMGWQVIDIQRVYKDKIVSNDKYSSIIDFKYHIRLLADLLYKIDVFKIITIIMVLYIIFVKL